MTKGQPLSISDEQVRDALTRSPDALRVSENLAGIIAIAQRTPQRRNPIPAWALIAASLALLLLLLLSAVVALSRPVRLAVGSVAIDEGYDIVLMNPDGSGRRPITTGPNSDWAPLFSPDGKWLAYWDADPLPAGDTCGSCIFDRRRLMVADLRDPDAAPSRGLADVANSAPWSSSWSPDSRFLAFADVEDAVRVIATVDVQTGARQRIGPADLDGWDPAWSPDGSTIAFVRGHSVPSLRGAYVIDTDGSDLRRVSTLPSRGSGFQAPMWSSDGTRIAFANETGGADPFQKDIWIVGLDGAPEVDISNNPADEFSPTWSPGGSRLAYLRQQSPASPLWNVIVSSADGGNAITLPESVTKFSPSWSPDGDHILAVEPASGTTDQPRVVLIDVRTGASQLLAYGAPNGDASFLLSSR